MSRMNAKRHDDWSPFTTVLCRTCIQRCVWKFLIRYPVLAYGKEVCACPCRHEHPAPVAEGAEVAANA